MALMISSPVSATANTLMAVSSSCAITGQNYTADALDNLLTQLQEKGYQLVPISELIYREKYHLDVTGKQIAE